MPLKSSMRSLAISNSSGSKHRFESAAGAHQSNDRDIPGIRKFVIEQRSHDAALDLLPLPAIDQGMSTERAPLLDREKNPPVSWSRMPRPTSLSNAVSLMSSARCAIRSTQYWGVCISLSDAISSNVGSRSSSPVGVPSTTVKVSKSCRFCCQSPSPSIPNLQERTTSATQVLARCSRYRVLASAGGFLLRTSWPCQW